MKRTTLCYLEKDGCFLMLYRNKKKNDDNEGKWLGIGGKFEPGETADECNVREVREETGIELNSSHFYGVVHFRATTYEDEDMYLYSSDDFSCPEALTPRVSSDDELTGYPVEFNCDEGELRWIPRGQLMELPMWEGDRAFLQQILEGRETIRMTLWYEGEECTVIEE